MIRYLSTLFLAILISITSICCVGLVILYYYGAGLPDYKQLAKYEPPILSRLYANDGRMYAEYASEKRIFVPLKAIPKHISQAFISAEDKNFYQHIGIDFMSILGAAVANISRIQESKRPIGASTITQQVARNFLLTDMSTKVSIERKIKEAILAFRIEEAFTKDHILELYLNEIYLGAGSYGVAAAALNYFNKGLNELTIGDAAFLAALPKAPSRYHPAKAPELARIRRNYVLRRMYEDGYITASVMQQEIDKAIEICVRDQRDIIKADYFAEEVRRELIEKYGEQALYQDGLVVRTTLNPELQTIATESLRAGLIDYDKRHGWRGPIKHINLNESEKIYKNGAKKWLSHLTDYTSFIGYDVWKSAIVLDLSATQAVIGLNDGRLGVILKSGLQWARKYISAGSQGPVIGSPKDVLNIGDVIFVQAKSKSTNNGDQSFDAYELCQVPAVSGALLAMDPHTGHILAMQGGFSYNMSQFNRATQAMRQTGSAFKTFVYLTAFERGLTPATKINDGPFSIELGYGLGTWSPHNYEDKFWGDITLRRAFELSRNTVTVRMTHEYVGMQHIVETAKRFGIIDKMPLQLAMVLGAGETTLLKMVRATAMIANEGKEIEATFINRIQDRQGKTMFGKTQSTFAQCLTDMNQVPFIKDDRRQLTDAASAYQMISMLEGVATRGTGRILKELERPVAGKSGTTNDFKDAWFIGFTPDLIVGVYVGFDQPRYMGKHESGGRLASPIVKNFLKAALVNIPAKPFRIPQGIKLVRVNALTGKPAAPRDPDAIWEAFKPGTEVKKIITDDGLIADESYDQDPDIEDNDDYMITPEDIPSSADGKDNLGGLY